MSRARAQAVLTECFGTFGPIKFPYVQMGKIDSLHLFGETELMILALYVHNRPKWKRILDIGANLGLHSICLSKLGLEVNAYEPDPVHFAKLVENLAANHCNRVTPHRAAVHTSNGTTSFVRVLNNLTGNHIAGFKESYGPRETIEVPMVDCKDLWAKADFAKIDCEGNEAELAKTMTAEVMSHMSCVMEVRNEANAQELYDHFGQIGVPIWSQKKEWERVKWINDMPMMNREGSIYIGHKGPWD